MCNLALSLVAGSVCLNHVARADFIIDPMFKGSIDVEPNSPSASSVVNLGVSLNVGVFAAGEVLIDGGTDLTSDNGTIGVFGSGVGKVTVTGDSTNWLNDAGVTVGDAGDGTLNILAGGRVYNTDGAIGSQTGSSGSVSIDGAQSFWLSTAGLTVGGMGSASLVTSNQGSVLVGSEALVGSTLSSITISGAGGVVLVQNGGTISHAGNVVLGDDAGESGTATVTGPGSTWTNTGGSQIGNAGHGTLNVEAGGMYSSGEFRMAEEAGSSGTITVTGENSHLQGTSLGIGLRGNGTLNINNGGMVESTLGSIGSFTGAIGSVTINGEASAWNCTGGLTVGGSGNGTLNIEAGGTMSNTQGYIGYLMGSTGAVTVTGTDSTWTNSGILSVGSGGNGSLDIELGGSVSNTDAILGTFSGTTGEANVTGAGSIWTSSGDLKVGREGTGTLNISGGAQVTNDAAVIGDFGIGVGSATVTGNNSVWTSSSSLTVGFLGDATLLVEQGGELNSSGAFIAANGGSNGEATVTGNGSAWNNDFGLYVGGNPSFQGGTATLNVFDQAEVNIAAEFKAYASGSVNIDGDSTFSVGSLVDSATLARVNLINGTLNVTSGGIDIGAPGLNLVDVIGNPQTVTVAGLTRVLNGGSLTVNGGIFEANGGLDNSLGGTLSHTKGHLTVRNGAFIPESVSISYDIDGMGGNIPVLTIGTGGTWTSTAQVNVGVVEFAILRIEDGGSATHESSSIGGIAGGFGSATVTGNGSSWTTTTDLLVGYLGGIGTLYVEDGGNVTSGNVFLGGDAFNTGAGQGSANVTGPNSVLNVNFDLFVGFEGIGGLSVSDGGIVNNGAGTVTIADGAGSSGTLNIGTGAAAGTLNAAAVNGGSGAATVYFNHTDTHTFAPTLTGSLAVNKLASGTTILTAANSYAGPTNVNAGMLLLSGSGSTGTGTTTVSSSATLGGDGTVQGDLVVNSGGTLAPGLSPGILNANGNAGFNGDASLSIELGGTSGQDRLAVSGTTTLSGSSKLQLAFFGEANPADLITSGTYTILSSGSLSGTFGTVTDLGVYDDGGGVTYSGTSVDLVLTKNLLAGDANLDGTTNGLDLNILGGGWLGSGGWAECDFNGDSVVNGLDLNILGGEWLVVASSAESSKGGSSGSESAIPEPGSAAFLVLGGAALIARRRRGNITGHR